MMKLPASAAAIAIVITTAFAEPLPVAKPPGPGGSCPFGYISSGLPIQPRNKVTMIIEIGAKLE
jgi:hypothetical protein